MVDLRERLKLRQIKINVLNNRGRDAFLGPGLRQSWGRDGRLNLQSVGRRFDPYTAYQPLQALSLALRRGFLLSGSPSDFGIVGGGIESGPRLGGLTTKRSYGSFQGASYHPSWRVFRILSNIDPRDHDDQRGFVALHAVT